jgi:hypothetical protein
MDSQTLLAVFGIALSILFFIVGYRKTIGAKKERVSVADREIVHGLAKRLVLEDFAPTREEIDRFAAGKARQHLIAAVDVLSAEEVIDALYATVVDNDFIGPDDRKRIVEKLRQLSKASAHDVTAEDVSTATAPILLNRRRLRSLSLAAASTLLASATVALLELLRTGGKLSGSPAVDVREILSLTAVTFALASIAVVALLLFRRIKDAQEETRTVLTFPGSNLLAPAIAVLRKRGLRYRYATSSKAGYDLEFGSGSNTYIVQLRSSLRRVPPHVLTKRIEDLEEAANRRNAAAAILLTGEASAKIEQQVESEKVKVLNLPAFRDFVEQLPPSPAA